MPDFTEPKDATPCDLSGLKKAKRKSITTRQQLYAAELENIRKPFIKYLASRPSKSRAPFSFPWLFKLHKEMFGDLWTWAGLPRQADKSIGIDFTQIDVQLLQLVQDLEYWQTHNTFPLIEQAARLHHRSVQIHPFENGNGRWSRLLASIWLKRNGLHPTEWPEDTIGTTSVIRGEYIAAVKAADQYNLQLLIALHEKYTPTK